MPVPHFNQETEWTCGPACMRMVLASCKIHKSEQELAKKLKTSKKTGTDHKEFPRIAEEYELDYVVGRENSTVRELRSMLDQGFKVIICYYNKKEGEGHYAVIKALGDKRITLVDPLEGPAHSYSLAYFKKIWYGEKTHRGWYIGLRKN